MEGPASDGRSRAGGVRRSHPGEDHRSVKVSTARPRSNLRRDACEGLAAAQDETHRFGMRVWLVAICLVLSGCSWSAAGKVTLAAAATLTVCDWSQTRSWAELGWQEPEREQNPILGGTPSAAEVDAYFWLASMAALATWHVIPERWRPAAAGGVAVMQALTVRSNAAAIERKPHGRSSYCGL